MKVKIIKNDSEMWSGNVGRVLEVQSTHEDGYRVCVGNDTTLGIKKEFVEIVEEEAIPLLDIPQEIRDLHSAGITIQVINENQPSGFLYGFESNNHDFMTKPLEKYVFRIYLDSTREAVEGMINDAKKYLSDRKEYKSNNSFFSEILKEFGPVSKKTG